MGKIIVLEGLDGCGKSTQLEILYKNLADAGYNVKEISFPDYDAPSCAPVKMYLAGEFGTKPDDVNAYAASSFYAVDRFSSYKRNWEEFYQKGGIIVCGRYVTSNAIHQASKLSGKERDDFLCWLSDYEYDKIGIPRPDMVLFLDMSNELSQKMLEGRYNGDEEKKDIHERDLSYRDACRNAAKYVAKKWNWQVVDCADGDNIRSVESIGNEIFDRVTNFLNGEKQQ